MIEINHTLLNSETLDNLLIDIITRQSSGSEGFEVAIENKKKQLMNKLQTGEAVIIYDAEEGYCDIIQAKV